VFEPHQLDHFASQRADLDGRLKMASRTSRRVADRLPAWAKGRI
jgi:hypothetical protein